MQAFKIIVKGKVQGVSYRMHAKKMAHQLSVYGWVKNCENGDVMMEVHGDESSVENMIRWCNKGPALARVDRLDVEEVVYEPDFKTFEIVK